MTLTDLRKCYKRCNAGAPDVDEMFEARWGEDGQILALALKLLLDVAEAAEGIRPMFDTTMTAPNDPAERMALFLAALRALEEGKG